VSETGAHGRDMLVVLGRIPKVLSPPPPHQFEGWELQHVEWWWVGGRLRFGNLVDPGNDWCRRMHYMTVWLSCWQSELLIGYIKWFIQSFSQNCNSTVD